MQSMRAQWMIPILAYHRVGEPQGDHVPTVTPENFDRHLKFLSRFRYNVLNLEQFADHVLNQRPFPRKSVLITFDDGYVETATIAAPRLRRYGFPAVVFVAPAELEHPGFLNWTQVRELADDSFRVGGHTMHHTFLPVVPADRAEQELVESRRILEQRLGRPVDTMSYPVGGYSQSIQQIAKASGYRLAFTTNRGISKRLDDPLAVRRIKMTDRDTNPLVLLVKLSGYYDCFRRLEDPS